MRWENFTGSCLASGVEVPGDPDFIREAEKVFLSSRFVYSSCIRDPGLIIGLREKGRLSGSMSPEGYKILAETVLYGNANPDDFNSRLRRLRKKEMVRIAWRDITGRAGLNETMRDLSLLAEACLAAALDSLYAWCVRELGHPALHGGSPPGLIVIGMGKLGAGELNFSSDIDVMFAHPGQGTTAGASRVVSNDEFFARLARRLISAIGSITPDGFVFRMDTRLRPFGEGGPLVTSTQAVEDYYEQFGRDWERYALIKARPVAGDIEAGKRLIERLRPFVYKRYLDYEMFDALRSMKAMIETEMADKDLKNHIKLGPGGIREIEFICQAIQLIQGGRVPELQEPGTLKTLKLLEALDQLPGQVCQDLRNAYCFLRTLEHRLQEYDDQQTHNLPTDPFEGQCVALSMGYPSYEELYRCLESHRSLVHTHFSGLLAPGNKKHGAAAHGPGVFPWQNGESADVRAQRLREMGFRDPEQALSLIMALTRGKTSCARRGPERLNLLIPSLVRESAATADPDTALSRVIKVVESIGRRPCYLSLLTENPGVLSHLASLCQQSAWVTDMLARHPILLDELLHPEALYSPVDKKGLETELKGIISRVPPEDLELAMDELRRFCQANMLRVAAADLSGALDVSQVGERLTYLAEIIINEVICLSWAHMLRRHGMPDTDLPCDGQDICGITVIGYGKLGGAEMGYGSDLDMVFLHAASPGGMTSGPRFVDASVFYSRLVQRMIHIFTAHTSAGVLYPVDMRLRPDGASGVLVTGFRAFSDYQNNKAWMWEHQALVRARALCGDSNLAAGFQGLRDRLLRKKRDRDALTGEISRMRCRITEQALKKENRAFDLKRHPGGLVDIEFLVQMTVLLNANRYPELTAHTNALDLLAIFRQKKLMETEEVMILEKAYKTFMAAINRLLLDQRPPVSDDSHFKELRGKVLKIWEKNVRQGKSS